MSAELIESCELEVETEVTIDSSSKTLKHAVEMQQPQITVNLMATTEPQEDSQTPNNHYAYWPKILRSFKCTKCSQRYLKASDLKRHLETQHQTSEINPETCPTVENAATNAATICEECRRVNFYTDQPKYECPYCPVRFADKTNIVSHMSEHSKFYAYKCKFCWRSYKYENELIIHLRDKHCQIPTVSLSDKENLRMNNGNSRVQDTHFQIFQPTPSSPNILRNETSAKNVQKKEPNSCLFCQKTFRYRLELFKHVMDEHPKVSRPTNGKWLYGTICLKHLNDKSHKCHNCPKKYFYRTGPNPHPSQLTTSKHELEKDQREKRSNLAELFDNEHETHPQPLQATKNNITDHIYKHEMEYISCGKDNKLGKENVLCDTIIELSDTEETTNDETWNADSQTYSQTIPYTKIKRNANDAKILKSPKKKLSPLIKFLGSDDTN